MKKIAGFLVFVLISFTSYAQSYWEQTAQFSGTPRHGAGSFTLNGYGYIAGGMDSSTQILSEVWKYDAGNDAWTQMNDLPVGVVCASYFSINDTVYFCNGWRTTVGSPNTTLFRYNEALDVWDSVSTYPGTPAYTCASFVLNGKAYVGIGYSPYTNELWQYDPVTNAWTAKSQYPGSLRQNATSFVVNGHAYVGLGATNFANFTDFYEYNDSTDTWTSAGTFPGDGRYAAFCMVINNKVYIGCGAKNNGSTFLNDMWELDPISFSWTQLNDYGGSERHSGNYFVLNDIGYAGFGRSGTFQTDFWKFVPAGLNEIKGLAYRDFNANMAYDSTETPVSGLLVEVNPGGKVYSTNSEGYFKAVADTQVSYSFNLLNIPSYFTLANTLSSVLFSSAGNIDSSTQIILTPVAAIQDLSIVLTAITPVRAGFDGFYNITCKNIGTTAVDTAYVNIALNPGLNYFETNPVQDTPVYSAGGDTLTWQLYDLQPGDVRSFNVKYATTFVFNLGDTVTTSAFILPYANDNDTTTNYASLTDTIIGSFDPNDKQVSDEALTPSEVANGKWLTYTIRFQNTGNYQANYVRLTDSIPAGLDISTFEMLSASHYPCTFILEGNHIIKWNFPNIVLPDSNANEPASHGFVKFRIKPASNLIAGDVIMNNAAIYFDFNPAVITNYAETVIASPQSLSETPRAEVIRFYPNPVEDYLSYILPPSSGNIKQLSVTDIFGRLIRNYSNGKEQRVRLGEIEAGVYTIRVELENGKVYSGKIVKE